MGSEVNKSSEVAVSNDTLLAFKNLEEIQAFGDKIAKSGLTPLKEGKDVMAAILFGRELGLQPMVSVNNIYPINGKGTLSVHIINALLQKNGIVVEVIRNYEPCVPFALKAEEGGKAALFDSNGKEVARNADGTAPAGSSPIVLREGFVDEVPKDHEVRGTKITNYKTVLKFTRQLKQPYGPPKDQIIESSYSISEAAQAGLTGKDNWKNYPKAMTLNRALAFGGRLIGSDIMMGMSETTELADAYNIPYKVVDAENGKVEFTQPKKEDQKSGNTSSISDAIVVEDDTTNSSVK